MYYYAWLAWQKATTVARTDSGKEDTENACFVAPGLSGKAATVVRIYE